MRGLHRRLYRLLLRLHPAPFRNEFARDMALDFDDALATLGVRRLCADALLSLARQWSAHLIPPGAEPARTPPHALLAGGYAQLYGEPMRPRELALGFVPAITLLALCCLALDAPPGLPPDRNPLYAASTPAQPSPAQGAPAPSPAQSAQPQLQPELLLYHPAPPLPSYEVATVKPIDPATADRMVRLPPGSFLSPLSIRRYIMDAYGATYAAQIVGGPDWLNKDAYTIKGKVPDDLEAAFQTMTRQDRINQNRGMQQSLLTGRFHLRAHFETRVLAVYALVPAKGGLRITAVPAPPEPKPGDPPIRIRPGDPLPPGTSMTTRSSTGLSILNGSAIQMPLLARILSGEIGDRPIVDHTGFSGYFDVASLTWEPLGSATDTTPDGPSLTVALEHSLGIRVIPAKAPIEVLVIDSIDRPSPN